MKPIPVYLRPPKIGWMLIVIAIALHFTFPIMQVIHYPANLTGSTIIILGLLLAVFGNRTFTKHRVELAPGSKSRTIVRDGPFKYSRNPMYVGLILIGLGVFVLLGSLVALIAPVLYFIYLNFYVIRMEEK